MPSLDAHVTYHQHNGTSSNEGDPTIVKIRIVNEAFPFGFALGVQITSMVARHIQFVGFKYS